MSRLIVADNPFAPDTWELVENADVCETLASRYERMPDGARLYLGRVAESTDITPKTPEDIHVLQELPDDATVYFINYPAGPVAIIIAVVVVAVAVAVTLLIPSIPKQDQRNVRATAGQNSLTNRSNGPRPLARIADIYGQVRSIPDLAGASFKRYVNNREVEVAHYIIGRGEFEIHDIRDGDTDLGDIAGSSAQVYSPGTSASTRLSNGDTPQLTVGNLIDYPVFTAHRVNEVNGQELLPPNLNTYRGDGDLYFQYPDTIEVVTASLDFSDYFTVGNTITLEATNVNMTVAGVNTEQRVASATSTVYTFASFDPRSVFRVGDAVSASYASTTREHTITNLTATTMTVSGEDAIGVSDEDVTFVRLTQLVSLDLSGTYEINSISGKVLSFLSPASVNANWNELEYGVDQESLGSSGTLIAAAESYWIGPFFTGKYVQGDRISLNFFAPQGLYKDNGKAQRQVDVTVEVELTECDSTGVVLGGATPALYQATLIGSSRVRSQRAVTLSIPAPGDAFYIVRARRVSDTDKGFEGSVVDEVRWNDCYTIKDHPGHLYGDVTSIIAETFATAGAQALKERRLNLLVTRKLPSRDAAGVAGTLVSTSSPREIIPSMFEDPVIGGRSANELDFVSLTDAIQDVEDHFGTTIPLVYGTSYDDTNISLEEMISSVAETCFLRPYRRGSTLSFRADIPNEPEKILFNHRNKKPRTEKRTVRFGVINDHDGVLVEWRDENGEPFSFELPVPGLLKPKKLQLSGLRSSEHAQLHAWRAWNKMRYQNLSVAFDALQEAALVTLRDPILVADNTRPDVITGDIEKQVGLTLHVRPNREIPVDTYTCQIQFANGIVQAVGVASTTARTVTLDSAPGYVINTEDGSYAKATFALVSTPLSRTSQRMLITSKKPKDGFLYGIECINDDPRYYEMDDMFSLA